MDASPIIIALSAINSELIQPLFHLTLMFSALTGLLSYMVKPLRRTVMRLIRNPRIFLPLAAIFGSGISVEVILGYFTG